MVHRWSPFRPPGPFVTPVHLDPNGRTGPTPGAARGPNWEKTSPGFYVPAGTERDRPEQRIVEALTGLHDQATLTGWGSVRMHGGAFFDGQALGHRILPVQVRFPPGIHPRPRPGVRFVEGPIDGVVEIHGLCCLAIVPSLFDCMRLRRNVRDAVVDLDMAAAARLTSVSAIRQYVDSRPSWRGTPGVPVVRAALRLAHDRSASPPETRLRLVWVLDARLPPPLVNLPVYDRRGNLLGIPDLLDPVAGLVVEYDGDDHRDPGRHSDDVDREARFRGVGLEVTRVTGRDLRRTPELVHRLHTARGRARFEPEHLRRWEIGR
jgi:hypothetical protein